jgi:phage gp16-like protein
MSVKRKALQHEIKVLKNKISDRWTSPADKKKAQAELERKQTKLDGLVESSTKPAPIKET